MEQFTSVDDYINHFTNKGYKLIRDTQSDDSRTLMLRSYTPTDFGEAIITQNGSKITLKQTLNGKPVTD